MSLATTAQRLIAAKGRTVRLIASAPPPTNADKPWRSPDDPVAADPPSLQVRAVFESKIASEIARALGQDAVRSSRQTFLVAGLDLDGFPIAAATKIEDGADVWRVTNYALVKPGSELVLATFEVVQ